MPTQQTIQIRAATLQEDALIAEHFYQMWLDNHVAPEAMIDHWQENVLQFINQARRDLDYQAFVAQVEAHPNQFPSPVKSVGSGKSVGSVGSVGCQRFAGLYPNIITKTDRCDGYIWGVYVEPAHRRQGIATQLTQHAIAPPQSDRLHPRCPQCFSIGQTALCPVGIYDREPDAA